MGKPKTIDSLFKRKDDEQDSKRHKASPSEPQPVTNEGPQPVANEAPQPVTNEAPQPVANEADLNNLERDPAKRKQIWEYPVNSREQVRRAYLSLGPYQIHLTEYANKGSNNHTRRFQYAYFSMFPNWLEYSPTTHPSYCFMCYLFSDKPSVTHGYDAFTVKGFDKFGKRSMGKIVDFCNTFELLNIEMQCYLVYRVVRLISTLPVSTATTERAFSAMKIFKTRLRNKMSDSYLADSLVINIEREIAEKIDSMSIIDAFKDLRDRKADL